MTDKTSTGEAVSSEKSPAGGKVGRVYKVLKLGSTEAKIYGPIDGKVTLRAEGGSGEIQLPKGVDVVVKALGPAGRVLAVESVTLADAVPGIKVSNHLLAFKKPVTGDQPVRVLPQAQERANFLIETLGGASALAELLDVSRSQPGRWKTGAESPSPEMSSVLIDLDYVMAKASLIWEPAVARQWLLGTEPFLEGARPIDVLRTRGSSEVIDALESVLAGAFA